MDVKLREATFSDAEIIYDLSNDEEVRCQSINKKQIDWLSHLQWFNSKLQDNKYKIILFYVNDEFAGQVKFELDSLIAIISISLHAKFRGKGLASIVLKMAMEFYLTKYLEIDGIVALIRPKNESSVRSFTKVGFVNIGSEIINQEIFLKYLYDRKKHDNKEA